MKRVILYIGGLRFALCLPNKPRVDDAILPFVVGQKGFYSENLDDAEEKSICGGDGVRDMAVCETDILETCGSGIDAAYEADVTGGSGAENTVVCGSEVTAACEPDVSAACEPNVTVTYESDASVPDWKITVSEDASRVSVRYAPDTEYRFAALRGCLIYIPMEEVLLKRDRFFLHASFVTSPWGGLLFTGDSGAGKSTQAELWRRHMGSTVINGDRAIVAKETTGWRAYGSPYAGSSGYYVQRDEPVRAIVLLEQAKENAVRAVSAAEAFQKLYLQISLNHDKPDQVNRLCDLLTDLIAAVPVYRLRCTPDARAVEVLRSALMKSG